MSRSAYTPPHKRLSTSSPNTPISQRSLEDYARRSSTESYSTPRKQTVSLPAETCVYCINLDQRTDKWKHVQKEATRVNLTIHRFSALQHAICDQVEPHWDATTNAQHDSHAQAGPKEMSPGEVGCARSHVALWRMLLESSCDNMLILEDDCQFVRYRFAQALQCALEQVPSDWGILYLGFSSRGPREYVSTTDWVHVYKPTYGFHTHAYLVTRSAAEVLLNQLPVQGPIDVWLADHQWFDVPTYVAAIAGEGWVDKETGECEGLNLVGQYRRRLTSDVHQSSPSVNTTPFSPAAKTPRQLPRKPWRQGTPPLYSSPPAKSHGNNDLV